MTRLDTLLGQSRQRARGSTVVTATESFRRLVKKEVNDQIDKMIDEGEVRDFSQASARATAHVVNEAMSSANRINDRVGPFYASSKIERNVGITRQAVSERARNHTLLRLATSDELMVFPKFQFKNDGEVRKNLVSVFKILLDGGVDPWTVAYWLTSPIAELDERTAIEAVDDGVATLRKLQALAKADVASMAS